MRNPLAPGTGLGAGSGGTNPPGRPVRPQPGPARGAPPGRPGVSQEGARPPVGEGQRPADLAPSGPRRPRGISPLHGYSRRAPLVRLIPWLLLGGGFFLLFFVTLVLWPSVADLLDQRSRLALERQEAMAAEAALEQYQEAAAARETLERQVQAAQARLVPIEGLSTLGVRLAAYGEEAGAVLRAVRFGDVEPLDGTKPRGDTGSETGEAGEAGGTVGGGGTAGQAGSSGDQPAGAKAGGGEGAGGAKPEGATDGIGTVEWQGTLEGPWSGVEEWLRLVSLREPAVRVDRLDVSEVTPGIYEVRIGGRVWVTGPLPAAPAAATR